MRSKQLLSIVFSVIMFTGVTAGSVAFAESDEYNDDYKMKYDKDIRGMLDRYCEMSDYDKRAFVAEHDKTADHVEKMNEYCSLDENQRDAYIQEHKDDYKMKYDKDIRGMLDRYCEMSDEDKRAFVVEHDKAADHVEKMNKYCSLDENQRDAYIQEHKDDYRMKYDKDIRDMKDRYCEMSDEDKRAFVAEHDKAADHVEKMNEYCSLDDDAREDYIKDHMRDYDFKKPHMDYDRLCDMTASDRALEITDVAKLDRISEWCEMTPDEREDYKRDHMKDKMMDKQHDFDGMSDMAKDRMSNVAKDILADKMKFSDQSPRLKAMIMTKYDITDERTDEIKMKFKEKHGDLTDERKTLLKEKFKNHMAKVKTNLTDEQKSDIHARIAEMKAFKADLRDRASDLTDEEKQELRADFIDKAKDIRHAWISPRTQMTAGLDAADVECREGFSLVMKASNGVAMCLKADTALKMIDRGIAVPAN